MSTFKLLDIVKESKKTFKKEPKINVITKEEFEERVRKVFHLLWETLSRSFGPYGAPTLIMNYPFSHVTKDGFTIMKNLSMDASETLVDQSIKDMADEICGRLNYTSGDGTTSAVIATNSIFQSYLEQKDRLENYFVLPRDIIRKFNQIKVKIIEELDKKVVPIKIDDEEDLTKKIHDVVYISSNGDEQITEFITDLYKELKSPGISCILAPDGITKKTYVNGYRFDMAITDHMYINSDDKTMHLTNSDVILFLKKVTATTYNEILKPLSAQSKARGRHLIVGATSYDETALSQIISKELSAEYRKNKDINMVLTVFRANSVNARKCLQDFAMFMNTIPIDGIMEKEILDQIRRGMPAYEIFNIDNREIPGIKCLAIRGNSGFIYSYGEELSEEDKEGLTYPVNKDTDIRLGFSSECSIGLKDSMFTGKFYYDKNLYETVLEEAKMDLKDKREKYKKLGTFNLEVTDAQNRLYALGMKMGVIEAGGDSELSGKMLKDTVDDSIKAASSAYQYGVVKGCNLDLILSIMDILGDETDEVNIILLDILKEGFIDVYRTILSNASLNHAFVSNNHHPLVSSNPTELFDEIESYFNNTLLKYKPFKFNDIIDSYKMKEAIELATILDKSSHVDKAFTLDELILLYSIQNKRVFDVTTMSFSDNIINSVETDRQILAATIDLISLLITGNQMVVTQKHNFED